MAASKNAHPGPPRPVKRRLSAALIALAALGALSFGIEQSATAAGPGRPNIIFFLTDDQTVQELAGMPNTNALLTAQGINFTRNYISYPLCCPSRATFLTGRYMHNHGVRGNGAPFGGAKHFQDLGGENTDLPTQLKMAGYHTVQIGKYLNGYGGGDVCGDGSVPHVPQQGWDEWYAKIAATNGACSENNYYQYSLFEQGSADTLPHPAPGQVVDYGSSDTDYQTDVYKRLALGVLDQHMLSSTPLYMAVNFGAPHGPFEPAPRHKFRLEGVRLPRLPGFDEKNVSDKPRFIRNRARRRLSSTEKFNIAERRKRRLEQLLAVDEAVAAIYNKVAAIPGELNNTYFVFTSDNGFFSGEHRIGSGKYLPYEPSARVPLVIKGPNIPPASSSSELTANVDYAPTVLQIAGVPPSPLFDGRSLLPFAENPGLRSRRPILLEGDTGPGTGPGQPAHGQLRQRRMPRSKAAQLGLTKLGGVTNLDMEPGFTRYAINGNINVPAYKSIRTNRYEYTIYATGESELYDMKQDPAQLNNVAKDRRYRKVVKFLYPKLLQLSFCYASACSADIPKEPKPQRKR